MNPFEIIINLLNDHSFLHSCMNFYTSHTLSVLVVTFILLQIKLRLAKGNHREEGGYSCYSPRLDSIAETVLKKTILNPKNEYTTEVQSVSKSEEEQLFKLTSTHNKHLHL